MDVEVSQTGRRRAVLAAIACALALGATGWALSTYGGRGGGQTPQARASQTPPPGYPVEDTLNPAVADMTSNPGPPGPLFPNFSPPPPPTPGSRAAAFRVAPPALGGQLLWYRIDDDQVPSFVRLHAAGWDGRDRGTIQLRVPDGVDGWVVPSPDGSRLLLGGSVVYDAAGAVVGTVNQRDPGARAGWSDDNRHLCFLTSGQDVNSNGATATYHAHVFISAVGGAAREVAVEPDVAPGDSLWRLAACSSIADRLVLVRTVSSGASQLRVVSISTGASLLAIDYPQDHMPFAAIATTRDAALIVESDGNSSAIRRDLRTGQVAPWSQGGRPIDGFAIAVAQHIAVDKSGVVDTDSARSLWVAPTSRSVVAALLQPGGRGVALEFMAVPPPASGCYGPCTVPQDESVVVTPSGGSVALPLGAFVLWPDF